MITVSPHHLTCDIFPDSEMPRALDFHHRPPELLQKDRNRLAMNRLRSRRSAFVGPLLVLMQIKTTANRIKKVLIFILTWSNEEWNNFWNELIINFYLNEEKHSTHCRQAPEKNLGRPIRCELSLLAEAGRDGATVDSIPPSDLKEGKSVRFRTFHHRGPKWKRGVVVEVRGPRYLLVRDEEGVVFRRHRDQVFPIQSRSKKMISAKLIIDFCHKCFLLVRMNVWAFVFFFTELETWFIPRYTFLWGLYFSGLKGLIDYFLALEHQFLFFLPEDGLWCFVFWLIIFHITWNYNPQALLVLNSNITII